MNKDQILEFIGEPSNDRLRELRAMLVKFRYSDHELRMLEAEVMAATPPRKHRRVALEAIGR